MFTERWVIPTRKHRNLQQEDWAFHVFPNMYSIRTPLISETKCFKIWNYCERPHTNLFIMLGISINSIACDTNLHTVELFIEIVCLESNMANMPLGGTVDDLLSFNWHLRQRPFVRRTAIITFNNLTFFSNNSCSGMQRWTWTGNWIGYERWTRFFETLCLNFLLPPREVCSRKEMRISTQEQHFIYTIN